MKLYDIFLSHSTICTDSRACEQGSLFFALKGENFDANAFALSALEKGCAYAVIDNPKYAVDERFILVDDTLKALQDLAAFHRKALGTKIIGITGSNGKTTTKELIATVLKQKYNTHFTQGNFNNHIGVPLTLLQLRSEHEIAVIEMGANHQGEIKMLSEIAAPDWGIITNVGIAHLEGFTSFEGVKQTKAELYTYLQKHSGKIFLNSGNEFLVEMAKKSGFELDEHVLTYQVDSNLAKNLATARIVSCNPLLKVACETTNGKFDVKTQLIGTYNAENILSAIAIGHYFGISNEKIKEALENYIPQNNRSQFTETGHNKLIIDAYNANPTSMRAAILNFAQMKAEHKTLIIGDMLELGSLSEVEHQKIVELIKEHAFSEVYLVGKCFQKTNNDCTMFADIDKLKTFLQNNPLKNRFILIKGSRGIHLEKIINEL